MDKNDLTNSFAQGEPGALEHFTANIRDGFDNNTLGVAYQTFKENLKDTFAQQSNRTIESKMSELGFAPDSFEPVPESPIKPKTLTKDEWKKSSYFRDGLDFKDGFTEARAKVMAETFDDRQLRQMTIEAGGKTIGRKAQGFVGQMVAGVVDPINLIPFGTGFKAASLGGKVVLGAAEGAVSNLAVSAVTRPYWESYGVDSSWQDYVNDLAIGGIFGGGFATLGHGASKLIESRQKRAAIKLSDRANLGSALDHAVESIQTGKTPDLNQIEGLKDTIKNLWDIPEVQRSQKVSILQDQLVKDYGFTPDDARASITPMVAHAQTFASSLGMNIDDFIEKYGISNFSKSLPERLPKAKSIGDVGGVDIVQAKINSELQAMVNEIKYAEVNSGLVRKNGEGTGEVLGRFYDNTFPEWYRETGAKNKEDFFKIVESKKGKRYEKLLAIAEDRLLNGYENITSGRVMPDNEFRTIKGQDQVVVPGADAKGKVIKFDRGEGLVELPNGEVVYFDQSVMKRDVKVGDEVSVSIGNNPDMLEASTLFQFAGPKANTADMTALNSARILESQGKNLEEIRKETGWFKGKDNKWRFEIDDSAAKFKDIDINKKKKFKLGDVLIHEELFKAYPDLKNINVEFATFRGRKGGHFEASSNTIKIMISKESFYTGKAKEAVDRLKALKETPEYKAYANDFKGRSSYEAFRQTEVGKEFSELAIAVGMVKPETRFPKDLNVQGEAMNIILHEIQHSIQSVEGFARGGNKTSDGGFVNYRNLLGEIEARDVEARKAMTPQERLNKTPETMNANQAIVKWRGEEIAQDLPPITETPTSGINQDAKSGDQLRLFQKKGAEKGAVTFAEDGKAIVTLFEKADQSTILHETGHIFLRNMETFSAMENATPEMKRDFQIMKDWLGVKDKITVEHHEKFARGFEQFLREGVAPRPELQSVFEKFKNWLTSIYKSSEDLNVKLSDDAREVYSRLLGGDKPEPRFEAPAEVKAPDPIFKSEDEIDQAVEEIAQRYKDSGLLNEVDHEELQALSEHLIEIKKEEDALDAIGEYLTLFQSEPAKKADLEEMAKKVGITKKEFEKLAKEVQDVANEQFGGGQEGINEFAILKAIEEKKKQLAIEVKEKKRQVYLSKIAKEKVHNQAMSLINEGADPRQAILSQIEGDSKLRGKFGSGDSVYGTYHSMSQSWLSKMHTDLKQVSERVEKLFANDSQFNENVITEMMQIREDGTGKIGITGDNEAVAAAKILSDHAEMARQRLNLSGAKIGKLDGWVPRVHDVEKIILKGEKAWKEFMLNSLDLEKTFPNIKDDKAALDKALYETYQNIITEVRKERGQIDGSEPLIKAPRNVAKKLGESRVLHFKDSALELSYLKEYGQGSNILETMSRHMDIAARKTTLLERLGPNPDSTIASAIETLRQNIRDKKIYSDLPDADRIKMLEDLGDKTKVLNREGDIGKSLMFMLGEGNSFEAPRMKQFAQTVRALNSVSKLGSATLSQFADFLNLVNEHRIVRDNNFASAWLETMKHYFQEITPEKQKVLDRLGVMADTINFKNYNRFDADNINNKLGRMNDILFKLSGQELHTTHAKSGFALAMSKDLGELINLDFDNLPNGYKEVLSQYGSIDSKKWSLLKTVEPELVDGDKYFHPDLVQKIDKSHFEDLIPDEFKEINRPQKQDMFPGVNENPGMAGEDIAIKEKKFESKLKNWEEYRDFHLDRARFDLENNLRTFFIEEGKNAVLEPDLKTKRITSLGTKSGTVTGEAARLMTQFKSFAFAYYDRTLQGRRFAIDKDSADYGGVIHQAVASMMLGYVAMTAKDLSKGLVPKDPTKTQTWLQAAFQSGGLGIMGDFVQAGVSSRSGADALATFAGPTLSLGANILNTGGQILREPFKDNPNYEGQVSNVIDIAKGQVPFGTLWYTRAAVDFLLWHQIKEALEPGSIRRSERRLKREYNQEYLMSPSEVYGH